MDFKRELGSYKNSLTIGIEPADIKEKFLANKKISVYFNCFLNSTILDLWLNTMYSLFKPEMSFEEYRKGTIDETLQEIISDALLIVIDDFSLSMEDAVCKCFLGKKSVTELTSPVVWNDKISFKLTKKEIKDTLDKALKDPEVAKAYKKTEEITGYYNPLINILLHDIMFDALPMMIEDFTLSVEASVKKALSDKELVLFRLQQIKEKFEK